MYDIYGMHTRKVYTCVYMYMTIRAVVEGYYLQDEVHYLKLQ